MSRSAEVPDGKDAVPAWVAERLQDVRAHLDVRGPATGATAARARRAFATWLAVDLAAGDLVDDLVLAVYEAVANAVDHAYRRTVVGPVRLLARRTHRAVHVTVADHGTWCEAAIGGRTAGPGDVSVRGRGLAMIRRLVPNVYVELSTTGTTVHLRAPAPSPS
jgi:anti-sigma regulatory factor (Ser/Thr protein kinase)